MDISFFSEDPFELDELAKAQGVVAVMDAGVAPGMSNIILGYHNQRMKVERYRCLVGGLPVKREWPWEYKAVFSPVDVIEEYVRPARYVENGALVVRPALSDSELIDFPEVGTLEAFNTDGLRTLIRTIGAPNMKEKTLRFPGHIEKMALLRDSGFFSEEPIEVGGAMVKPLDVTAKLLFPMWELKPGDGEFTVMQINVEGEQGGRRLRYRYDLLDRFDHETGTTSMARTTGYTATLAVRMVADGLYKETGISPPEYMGRIPGCVPYLLKGLAERGVVYTERIETLD